ncbi:MAG TPA: rod shape-determining protein RodA [Planktothrix sp.]|jgi:rod shape determining protein RodA
MTLRATPFAPYLRGVSQFFNTVDLWLLAATSFLVWTGLTVLNSRQTAGYFDKQIDFMWAGLVLLVVFSAIPYKVWLQKWVNISMYVVNLGLLVAVMLKGHSALGAQRWLSIGPITLQPSEIAKLVVIFTLSAWLRRFPIKSFFDIFKAAAIIAAPAVLVFKQPDLGTSLTFGAVFLGTVYWAGASVMDILVLASPVITLILNAISDTDMAGPLGEKLWLYWIGALGVTLLLFWRHKGWKHIAIRFLMLLVILGANYEAGKMRPHMWGMLKEYQQKRLTSFVNPYEDPRGSGYHILQSLIAIGSGGLNGAGIGKGNQSQGAFIPERHTDFIFAVVGEELGFRISALVVLAYAIICVRSLMIAYQSKNEPGGSIMSIAFMCLFLFHVFLNIGMTIGIMPVAGVPLPFLSYGGTALIVDLVSIGLLQSIRRGNPPEKRSDMGVV